MVKGVTIIDNDNMWFASCIIVGVVGIVFMVCFLEKQSKQVDQLAIKQGLVQKVEQAKIVWVKP